MFVCYAFTFYVGIQPIIMNFTYMLKSTLSACDTEKGTMSEGSNNKILNIDKIYIKASEVTGNSNL